VSGVFVAIGSAQTCGGVHLEGRTVRSFQEGQRIPHVSTRVASSEGQEPVQDVYFCTRMGYWSCSTTIRGWQGVLGGIRESTST
jgi:hypothetical protein